MYQDPIRGFESIEHQAHHQLDRYIVGCGGVVNTLIKIDAGSAFLSELTPDIGERVLSSIWLTQAQPKGLPASLDTPDGPKRVATVVVDSAIVFIESDAIKRLRGEHEHSLLLHSPLVARDDGPPANNDFSLAE